MAQKFETLEEANSYYQNKSEAHKYYKKQYYKLHPEIRIQMKERMQTKRSIIYEARTEPIKMGRPKKIIISEI